MSRTHFSRAHARASAPLLTWVSTSQGWIGTAVFLLPIGIALGVSLALVAAVMSEYATQR